MKEILAFDYGQSIVGMIDLRTDLYIRYKGRRMVDGARRILDCEGIVISFNGTRYDLPRLAELVGVADSDNPPLRGEHVDMQIEASRDRWPPDPGTSPIAGENLEKTYRHYFGESLPDPPDYLDDDYERNNWDDCYMTAMLWRKIVSRRSPPEGSAENV